THTYAEDGEVEQDLVDVFPLKITIMSATNSVTVITTAHIVEEDMVLNAQGGFVLNGKELQPVTGTVATFTGESGQPASAFKATIDWGDGTTSAGVITGPDQNGVFTVTGTHTYAEDGEVEQDLVDVFPLKITIMSATNSVTV